MVTRLSVRAFEALWAKLGRKHAVCEPKKGSFQPFAGQNAVKSDVLNRSLMRRSWSLEWPEVPAQVARAYGGRARTMRTRALVSVLV